jgi:hypothetical protein
VGCFKVLGIAFDRQKKGIKSQLIEDAWQCYVKWMIFEKTRKLRVSTFKIL